MNHYYILHILLILSLLITLVSGRALFYDELDEENNTELFSMEDKEGQDLKSNVVDDNTDDDKSSFDSYEEKKFHQQSKFSTSRTSNTISPQTPNTISPQTEQALIDILQKAFEEGFTWRPNLKHYVPKTRFGRH